VTANVLPPARPAVWPVICFRTVTEPNSGSMVLMALTCGVFSPIVKVAVFPDCVTPSPVNWTWRHAKAGSVGG